MMQDKNQTTFSFVMYPESTPIEEASRAMAELSGIGIETSLVIANLILPDSILTNDYLKQRKNNARKISPGNTGTVHCTSCTVTAFGWWFDRQREISAGRLNTLRWMIYQHYEKYIDRTHYCSFCSGLWIMPLPTFAGGWAGGNCGGSGLVPTSGTVGTTATITVTSTSFPLDGDYQVQWSPTATFDDEKSIQTVAKGSNYRSDYSIIASFTVPEAKYGTNYVRLIRYGSDDVL